MPQSQPEVTFMKEKSKEKMSYLSNCLASKYSGNLIAYSIFFFCGFFFFLFLIFIRHTRNRIFGSTHTEQKERGEIKK